MFNVGDMVFVPNAYEWIWESAYVEIKDIYTEDNKKWYIANCPHNNLFNNNDYQKNKDKTFEEKEIFTTKEQCDRYIRDYYYDGLCKKCGYEQKSGYIFRCNDCSHVIKIPGEKPTVFDTFKCACNDIVVGSTYGAFHEICKNYEPELKQNKDTYKNWEYYDDILKNCEFNPECIHHKKSCHKTCTYHKYINELMWIPYMFMIDGRKVISVQIKREAWIEQTFLSNKKLKCYALRFEPEYTKTGKVKKNYIRAMTFPGKAIIDIETGEISALAECY